MAKTKKLIFCAAMTLLFCVLIAMLCGNAARIESTDGEYASYETASGAVTYYNVVTEDEADSGNEGGDYGFNPADDISK